MKTPTLDKEAGSAIILVISILATLMVIVGIAVEYTTSITRNVQRSTTLENAISVANGCLDNNFTYWRAKCQSKPSQAWNSYDLSTIPIPTAAQFPNIPNFSATSNNYNPASSQTVQQCRTVAADPEHGSGSYLLSPNDPGGTDPSATPIPGIGPTTSGVASTSTTATYNYLSMAYVTLPSLRGNLVAKVQRVFQKEQVSPWNYALFYVDPLEIQPGPPFFITGWVHTNSDLYTGHNTLHFMDKVTFVGDWSIGFMSGDPRAPDGNAPETPTTPSWPASLPPQQDTSHEPFGINPSSNFDTTDSDPNNDGYHELLEPPVLPVASNPDPLAGQRYFDQANVIIQIDASNNVTVMRGNGDGTATTLTGSSTGNDLKLYNMFNGAVSTNQSIQDNREGATVRVATLDVSQIIEPNGASVNGVRWKGNPAFNGVLYIYDNSASANGVGAKRAIRLKNGSVIPGGGLTVASWNPVYLQGDYNTGTNPASNSGDPTTPQAAGYTRQPCSVLADAVNVLSNAWNDANSGTSPNATNTTVNSAIVSGIVPSANNNYSGGAENFPRFLETWGSGHTFTYYGSMIELYDSQQAIGKWGKPNVYDPPSRQWYFDTNFRLTTPPGTLMVYTYRKGEWALVQ
jgi:hypothetical protein